jgi:uncharacterized OB-fold protein
MEYKKPVPAPSLESQPYWDGLREQKLMMPWTQTAGHGRIFSYVVYHRVYHPAFAQEVPYAVAVIELDEGPRMISNVIGIAPDKLVCDMKVEVAYEPITEAITLPKFKPAAA